MVTIKKIEPKRSELKKFVKFQIDLYKGNDYYVPPLIMDDIDTLDPKKNPAFEFCEAQSFMAFRDNKPVGRVTAIINRNANKKFNEKSVRFEFIDFIDDTEVVDALIAAVEEWGRERGMNRIVGPLGFSDMDPEGMLIFGFEEMGTMATIYNYPYYQTHMERLGFVKETDYVEYRIKVPSSIPEKYKRVADIVQRRLNLNVVKLKSRKELKERYGKAIFDLINEAYANLYGFCSITPKQVDHYIGIYLGILRLDNICLITDANDNLISVGISMPSMSQALRRSGGKLFPFGWWYILQGLNGKTNVVDLLLVAVKPEYQNKGVNALLFSTMIPSFIANGYEYAETNVELEDNESVQKQWEMFERRLHRRRRVWFKEF